LICARQELLLRTPFLPALLQLLARSTWLAVAGMHLQCGNVLLSSRRLVGSLFAHFPPTGANGLHCRETALKQVVNRRISVINGTGKASAIEQMVYLSQLAALF
jgi:hypothetical protein